MKTETPESLGDPTWREIANKNGWTLDYPLQDPVLENLKNKLLGLGGWAVCLHLETDAAKILSRGRRFAGKAHMKRGTPSQCHSNSAALWDANRGQTVLCTGYALSKDGMWRQHSWCAIKTPRSYKVVETTMPRVLYYGFVLSDNESEYFLYNNS